MEFPTWEFDSDGTTSSNEPIDVEYSENGYLGAKGSIHRLTIDGAVHSGGDYRLFSGKLELEPFRKYEIGYEISCSHHGPRSGEIILQTGYDTISATHHPPRFWRAWKGRLWAIGKSNFTWLIHRSLERIPLDGVFSDSKVRSQWVIAGKPNPFEEFWVPTAEVVFDTELDEPISAEAIGTLYDTRASKCQDAALATVKYSIVSISPREVWFAVPSEFYRTVGVHFRYTSEIDHLSKLPWRISPNLEPFSLHPQSDLEIEWDTKIGYPDLGDQRGFEVVDKDLSVSEFGGRTRVTVTGSVKNTNSYSNPFFVVAKVYDSSGRVVATPYEREKMGSRSETKFKISTAIGLSMSTIDSCEIQLQRTIGREKN
ncbi:hypothetical protein [Haloferax sp. ATB1]|uniref:hypothetical protein n=1 Tax=Haloferax sp. ATB1 TaxID=1508454 RepID=UPI000FE1416E|nr:hypothetical protein [Haloferax sp. ATB1]